MAEIRIEVRVTSRLLRLAMIPALLSLAAPILNGESVTLTTYYPAPSGVYTQMVTTKDTFLARDSGNVAIGNAPATHKLTVTGDMKLDSADFVAFNSAPPLKVSEIVAGVPTPGRVFYKNDGASEGFYYSSKDAIASDPSTWYKAMTGLDTTTVLEGSKSLWTNTGWSNQTVKSWSYDPETTMITSGNDELRSKQEFASAGLYTVALSGKYCAKYGTPSQADPKITLHYAKFDCSGSCSTVSWGSWTTLGTISETLTLTSEAGGMCADFSLEGMVTLPSKKGVGVKVKYDADDSLSGSYTYQPISGLQVSVTRVMSF